MSLPSMDIQKLELVSFGFAGQIHELCYIERSPGQQQHQQHINGNFLNGKSCGKRKVIYVDSNDEMFYESELSDTELLTNGNNNHKSYSKITLKPTIEEKKRMRENMSR